jgi:P-type Cu+ transporter
VIETPVGLLLLALLCALLAAAWLALARRNRVMASMAPDGVQEVEVLVRGRYQPDTLMVRAGIPARLLFNRQEDTPCSDRVIFSDFKQEQWLAPFAITPIQFIPSRTGEFLFTCAMGMYQGHLLVKEPRTARTGGLNLSHLARRWASRISGSRSRVAPF